MISLFFMTDLTVVDGSFCGRRFSKERLSWYLYDGGVSVVSMLAMVMFVPIYLSSTATYASTNGSPPPSCSSSSDASVPCQICLPGRGLRMKLGDVYSEFAGTVDFFGMSINAKSFPTVTVTVSTVMQALLFITVGEFADKGSGRKRGLFIASVIGQMSLLAFLLLSDPQAYASAAILAIVANCCFGVSFVYYNAYLPVLVEADPCVDSKKSDEKVKAREIAQNRMSSLGFAAAYASSLLLAVLGACIHLTSGGSKPDNGFLTDRICIAMHGIWWALMSVPAWLWLKRRPGPSATGGKAQRIFSGWIAAWRLLKEAGRYPETFKFLLCFLFYGDTINTVAIVGVLFATQELCISTPTMALVLIEILLFATLGNLFYLYIYKRFNLNPKSILLWILGVYCFVCFWGCLGLWSSQIGMRNEWEVFMFAAVHGFHTGSLQSFSRTMFADLIVPGREGQFFSLYQITDKGGSWLGPLVVTLIQNATGSLRQGFVFLMVVTALSAIAFWFLVDHQKGMLQVGRNVNRL